MCRQRSEGADQAFLKALAPILDGTVSGNVIVAEAGILSNKAGLRPALEKSPRAIIVPLYEADDGDIAWRKGLEDALRLRNAAADGIGAKHLKCREHHHSAAQARQQ